ncbi:helix-turn-helix domain-containing protein [Oceanibacterium hippocampi]|uniref:HTH-type transcriptional regulator PuuR n=1 Tax=Oceanibacterium hippocampi TaxID=745714 RepID=A0A1Y5SJL5_9PROT|nr:XRE family transcriptional regulator [Oceanibacterium hippocampi]SLN40622.1 HTH-type transcriptional regulator PuuR [Oceanibacterium hippocampi]
MNEPDTRETTRLAERLKRLRQARGLSLQQLADRSGVSRASLSRIENAEVSPTADTLGALAAVFSMTISQILEPLEKRFQPLIRRAEQAKWEDGRHGFVRRSVSPPSASLAVELIRCTIAANQRIEYRLPPVPGLEHHLLLVSGALTVTIEGETHELRTGDCLRYLLFGASRFETGDEVAEYLIALH